MKWLLGGWGWCGGHGLSSTFYFSFVILALLTLFSNMKKIISSTFFPFYIVSASLDTKILLFFPAICSLVLHSYLWFSNHQVDKNIFSHAEHFSWGTHRKLELLLLHKINSYLFFIFLLEFLFLALWICTFQLTCALVLCSSLLSAEYVPWFLQHTHLG